ncbi:hypothetical protein [Arthrobacter zhaoguopingii]|uniref:hypothetical protein n=1 Tax=Arthrobacter zhaoguopingii TaxID=2681491 RepID=UPI00135A178F|nr:hypothetical protein [Arthrobacter zhaoguopingii]
MAIEFREKVKIKVFDEPEVAALRLEAQLNRRLPCPDYDPDWRLRDASESRSVGDSVQEVFEEFREHDLIPDGLFHDRRMPPAKDGEVGVQVSVHYPVSLKEIWVEAVGTNRMAVDGVTATLTRIKNYLEQPQDRDQEDQLNRGRVSGPSALPVSSGTNDSDAVSTAGDANGGAPGTYVGSSNISWLKRTWRDHTAQFLATLVAGLLVVALGVWLGLTPTP